MVIEDVSILKKSLAPTPHYVEMLRFIGIDAKRKAVEDLEDEQKREAPNGCPFLNGSQFCK